MFDPLTNMGSIYLLFKGNPRNLYYIGILDGSLDLRLFSRKEPDIIEITLIYKARKGPREVKQHNSRSLQILRKGNILLFITCSQVSSGELVPFKKCWGQGYVVGIVCPLS